MSSLALDVAVVVGLSSYRQLDILPEAAADMAATGDVLRQLGVPPDHIVMLEDPRLRSIRRSIHDARRLAEPDGRVWLYAAGHVARVGRAEELALLGLPSGTRARHRLVLARFDVDVLLVDGRVDPSFVAPHRWDDAVASEGTRGSGHIAPLLAGAADGSLDAPDGVIVSDEVLGALDGTAAADEWHVVWTRARCDTLATLPGADLSPFPLPDGPLPLVAVRDGWTDPVRRASGACRRRRAERLLSERVYGLHRSDPWVELVVRLAEILLADADSARLLGAEDAAAVKTDRVRRLASAGLRYPVGRHEDALHALLGRAALASNDLETAERHLEIAAASQDAHAAGTALLALGDLEYDRGALLAAVAAWERVPEAYRPHADHRIGWALHVLGDETGARAAWERVVASTDPNLEALHTAAASAIERFSTAP